jgi:PAS fold
MSHTPMLAVPTPAPFPWATEPILEDPLFQLLFEQSPLYVGVLEWLGDDARYLAVNPATASRLGRRAEDIRGRRARELGLPEEAAHLWGLLAAETLRRGAATQVEWEAALPSGLSSFRSTLVPLPAPAGSPPRFAYLTEDLTQVRALELRLCGPETPAKALAADVEQPLAHALHVLDVAGDEVQTLVATHPEWELEDVADALRDGIRHTRRAHQKLRELLWSCPPAASN